MQLPGSLAHGPEEAESMLESLQLQSLQNYSNGYSSWTCNVCQALSIVLLKHILLNSHTEEWMLPFCRWECWTLEMRSLPKNLHLSPKKLEYGTQSVNHSKHWQALSMELAFSNLLTIINILTVTFCTQRPLDTQLKPSFKTQGKANVNFSFLLVLPPPSVILITRFLDLALGPMLFS